MKTFGLTPPSFTPRLIASIKGPDSGGGGGPVFRTALEEALHAGHKKIDIYIWNEHQRVPAGVYVAFNTKGYPNVDVRIVVSEANVTTGRIIDDRFVIRYHFIGNSSGREGGDDRK